VGVNGQVFGFGMPDDKGVWKGLDVDTAKAIAAAVFGDSSKVKYVAVTAVQRLPALQSKEIDVLCRNTTATLVRETTNGLNFVHVNYYDGQGFMVPKKLNLKSAKQLGGATVCVLPGTTTEMNAADYFRKKWNDLETGGHRAERGVEQGFLCRPVRRSHLGRVSAGRAPLRGPEP
jgi:general L-amino acid transport system substrate-binding protein